MQLIQIIIEKKLELYEEFMLKREYLRAFSHFYSCINLSLAILEKRFKKENAIKRRKIWEQLTKKITEKNLTNMQMLIEQDMKIIIKARKLMEEKIESSDYYKSKLNEKGAIMVVGYAYPQR